MKKIILAALAVVFFNGMLKAQNEVTGIINAQTPEKSVTKQAVITWEKTSHNFGKIPQGKPVSVTYHFTNTGNGPLIITNVSPGCGCTTGDYSKQSISPGGKGFITLTYNAAAGGVFTKNATINTNTDPGTILLYFNGEVVAETQLSNKTN
ncbi:MAG: DUF1573 domain-containing protein [Bacteroidota bacterium]|nr:DUF1573 domain-containing protein [Bacteroidota bacterium]